MTSLNHLITSLLVTFWDGYQLPAPINCRLTQTTTPSVSAREINGFKRDYRVPTSKTFKGTVINPKMLSACGSSVEVEGRAVLNGRVLDFTATAYPSAFICGFEQIEFTVPLDGISLNLPEPAKLAKDLRATMAEAFDLTAMLKELGYGVTNGVESLQTVGVSKCEKL